MMRMDGKVVVKAKKYLSKVDPVMKGLIEKSIPFTLKLASKQSPFETLIRAVASQQLHGAAAEAILGRFIKLVPEKSFPEPDDVERLTDEQIRSAGLCQSNRYRCSQAATAACYKGYLADQCLIIDHMQTSLTRNSYRPLAGGYPTVWASVILICWGSFSATANALRSTDPRTTEASPSDAQNR
jgi:hypothetical protein